MRRLTLKLSDEDTVSRSVGLAHIIREDDGAFTGAWGIYTLKTAFQPIFAFNEGKLDIVAFEGLIRPFRDGEQQSPASFFDTCTAGDRLHIEALTRMLHLLNAGAFLPAEASVFINFDPSVFTDRAVADVALREMRLVLHEAGVDPRRVVCEVTEQKSSSQETLYDFIDALKAHGFRIAIDDYGADDSDILRVRELRPDIVKFDAYWTTKLMDSGPGFALLTTMVRSFAEQGIDTVFEGMEEIWQVELAEKAGASMLQGYALARPQIVPASFSALRAEETRREHDESAGTEALPARHVAREARTFGRRGMR